MTQEYVENPFKVRLTSAGFGSSTISFNASPNISESRSVNYSSLDPLHAPGQIQVYKNTSSRNFQISDVKIISRTIAEADRNLKDLWILRSWCMPRFGKSSSLSESQQDEREFRKDAGRNADVERSTAIKYGTLSVYNDRYGTELLGAPPPILYLSAYSRSIGSETKKAKNGSVNEWSIAQHINRIPVVINQLTIPYPNDIDYITTSEGVPMPMIMNLDLSLIETHSPNSYEGFSLDAFKKGRLQGF